MDFMKLFGTVIAVLFHPGSASKVNGKDLWGSLSCWKTTMAIFPKQSPDLHVRMDVLEYAYCD